MTDIQAAIGLGQMKEISFFNQRRLENATIYNEELHKINGISIPLVPDGYKHVYHQYTIKVNKELSGITRDELAVELKKQDIFPGVFYPKPLHLLKNFEKFGYKKNDLPFAEKICEQVLSLPVHPFVQKNDIYRIVEIITRKTR
jgi:dTDP-4-amino-4,6-dideoxygalactose transaminase